MGLRAEETLLIGDHAYDIEAGRAAGTMTMFLRNDSHDVRAATPTVEPTTQLPSSRGWKPDQGPELSQRRSGQPGRTSCERPA
jgi:FMN phosphatase YigB (HAD superfamily)